MTAPLVILVFDENINVYDITSLEFIDTDNKLCPKWSLNLKE